MTWKVTTNPATDKELDRLVSKIAEELDRRKKTEKAE
jgi:hypothetical protein